MTDEGHACIMRFCQWARIEIHIRGTDERPIVEFKKRRTNIIVGGKELKRLAAQYDGELNLMEYVDD